MSTERQNPLIRFASFEVYFEVCELRRYGYRIKLQNKPFQILVALLERPGGLVSREELRHRLWSDTFVDFDHNLNNAIDKLRKALNDSAEKPKFIETIPRRGYRFIGHIEQQSASLLPSQPAVSDTKAVVSSGSKPSLKNVQPPLDRIDSGSAVPSGFFTKRHFIVRDGALLAVFLLASLLMAVHFLAPRKLQANSVQAGNSAIRSLIIEKNGALDPIEEGFTLHSRGKFETIALPNASNHGVDRLKTISNEMAYYYRTLTAHEKEYALNRDWKLICVCALEQGQVSANIDFGPGKRRFDIELLQEGDKYYIALTKQISPDIEWEQQIEFPGVGDIDHPHTYELRFDHSSRAAALWIDGREMISGYRGHTQFLEDRGLMFGSYRYLSSAAGVGIFRTVRFEVR